MSPTLVRVLIAVFFVVHGLMYAGLTTVPMPEPGGLRTPFWPSFWRQNVDTHWLATKLGLPSGAVVAIGTVLWMLALPIIATEAYFGLGRLGFLAGGSNAGRAARQILVEQTAFAPEFLLRAWERGSVAGAELHRLVTYPFVHYSATHALFVLVFLLALGNMAARSMRPWRNPPTWPPWSITSKGALSAGRSLRSRPARLPCSRSTPAKN